MQAVLAVFLVLAPSVRAEPAVLPEAYSHNDYVRARPLQDALDRGFCAVEADVHLRDGDLLLGHGGGDVKPGVNLKKFYLDPLLARVRKNGGRVYKGGPAFLLMVEFKSDGEKSYAVLREQLRPYAEMLTVFTGDKIEEKAVTISITGKRPNDAVAADVPRFAGIDGDVGDLRDEAKALFPTISDDWRSLFHWRGGRLEDLEKAKLERYVREAHKRGRKLRFWGIPDRVEAWDLMRRHGVDFINTDKLDALREFLLRRDGAGVGRKRKR
jgi:hypothetical protein